MHAARPLFMSLAGPLLAVALAVFGGLATTGPAEAACLSSGEARDAVASGQAARLSAVTRGIDGDVVNAQLCESGGRLVYRLAVMQGGRVVTIVIDARSGAVLGR
ncbi:PepSY domain-containing protein [Methylobrevis albus]|uniref:PepSY domain-containing protein n=1 Tax=Methylobrevis albus TaxID=2793297 RepID=A0A931I0Q2_9HYPH|nr:PepSY domain-containing protein [Methylobrevis albus]MBH0237597.1 hypothetical protein [Methylobrevis albus]